MGKDIIGDFARRLGEKNARIEALEAEKTELVRNSLAVGNAAAKTVQEQRKKIEAMEAELDRFRDERGDLKTAAEIAAYLEALEARSARSLAALQLTQPWLRRAAGGNVKAERALNVVNRALGQEKEASDE